MRNAIKKLAAVVSFAGVGLFAPATAFAAPAHAAQPESRHTDYTVVAGETLSGIAADCRTTVPSLVADNRDRIANPDLIHVGQTIRVRTPQQWTVRRGDTLTQVSRCSGETVAQLAQRNRIADPNLIHVGQQLDLTPRPAPDVQREPRPATPAERPPRQPDDRPQETPQSQPTPDVDTAPEATPAADPQPSGSWFDTLIIALAVTLMLAAIAARIVSARRRATSQPQAQLPLEQRVFVLGTWESRARVGDAAVDSALFERIRRAALELDAVEIVRHVDVWWNGESLSALVSILVGGPGGEGAGLRRTRPVGRACAYHVGQSVPELGRVIVGYDAGPGDPKPEWPPDAGPPPSDHPPPTPEEVAADERRRRRHGPEVEERVRRMVIDGFETRVLEFGPENGPPVICVHGFAASAVLFRSLARYLAAAGHRVYAPDLPGGFGQVEPPEKGPVTPQLTTFLREAIEELTPGQRPVLVAHSQGAYVCAQVLAVQPRLVSTFVAIAPAGLDSARWMHVLARAWVGRLFAVAMAVMPDAVRSRFLAWGYRKVVGRSGAKAFGRRLADRATAIRMTRSGLQFLAELLAAGFAPATVGVPAFYLWGTDDNTTPPTGIVRLHAEAPSATVRVLPGLGHSLMLQDPETASAEILAWIRRQ